MNGKDPQTSNPIEHLQSLRNKAKIFCISSRVHLEAREAALSPQFQGVKY